MRPPPLNAVRRRGFTLLELVLAAGIRVVAGAIIVPNLIAMQKSNRLPGMADDLRALLVSLRTRAIEEGIPYEFALGTGGNSYILRKPDDPVSAADAVGSADADGRVELDHDGALGEHQLPETLRLEPAGAVSGGGSTGGGAASPDGSVRFHPDGTSSGFAFRLTGDTGSFLFRIRTLSGAVKSERQPLGAGAGS